MSGIKYYAAGEWDADIKRTPPDVTDLVEGALARFRAQDLEDNEFDSIIETEVEALKKTLYTALVAAQRHPYRGEQPYRVRVIEYAEHVINVIDESEADAMRFAAKLIKEGYGNRQRTIVTPLTAELDEREVAAIAENMEAQ